MSPCTSAADKVATAGSPGDGVVGLVTVDFGVGDNIVPGEFCGVGARVGLGISTAWVHPATASKTRKPSFRSGFKIVFSPKGSHFQNKG